MIPPNESDSCANTGRKSNKAKAPAVTETSQRNFDTFTIPQDAAGSIIDPMDYTNIPEALLKSAAILDVADYVRGFDSIKAGLNPEEMQAYHPLRRYLAKMAKRYPDGIAPRDLPREEAANLVCAMMLAVEIGREVTAANRAQD